MPIGAFKENQQLHEQLAAEREKVKALQDALNQIRDMYPMDEAIGAVWIRAEDNPGYHRHE